jgi:hypothetical protein
MGDGLMKSEFEFNFDEWAELAKRDPEAFIRRRDLVMNEISEELRARSPSAVKGICWRIEVERKRCATPLQLCLKLSSMMWNRHADLTNMLHVLSDSNQKFKKSLDSQNRALRKKEKPQLRLVEVPSSDSKQCD